MHLFLASLLSSYPLSSRLSFKSIKPMASVALLTRAIRTRRPKPSRSMVPIMSTPAPSKSTMRLSFLSSRLVPCFLVATNTNWAERSGQQLTRSAVSQSTTSLITVICLILISINYRQNTECHGRIQRNGVRVRSNRLRQIFHYARGIEAGDAERNHSKVREREAKEDNNI